MPPCTRPPRLRGWSSSISPRAALVVITGTPVRAANASNAGPAAEKWAPDPASATGRSASDRMSTARSTSARGGAGFASG